MTRTHGYRSWQNLRGCTTREYFLMLTRQQPSGAFSMRGDRVSRGHRNRALPAELAIEL